MLNIWRKENLAQRLNISLDVLEGVACEINSYCTIKPTTTKKGKVRNVAKTSDILKHIQRRILDNLLSSLSISPDVHGAVPGRSSKTNACVHSGQRCVFTIDLKSCFPNVHSLRVRKLFQNQLGCSPDVSGLLTRLTTFDFHLTQGFSTSAAILNLLCVPLDHKIMKFLKPKGLLYTRYVDDITISGQYITEYTRRRVREIILGEGFILNRKKECFSSGEKAVIVTGLNVFEDMPKVPRAYKKNLRAAKHKAAIELASGDSAHEITMRSIKGKEQYIKNIEG